MNSNAPLYRVRGGTFLPLPCNILCALGGRKWSKGRGTRVYFTPPRGHRRGKIWYDSDIDNFVWTGIPDNAANTMIHSLAKRYQILIDDLYNQWKGKTHVQQQQQRTITRPDQGTTQPNI